MVTTTGDLANNMDKLKMELHKIKFPAKRFSEPLVRRGEPAGLLPILHYTLLNFSKPLAKRIVDDGYELNGKTDLRFLETVWKLLRELLAYRPLLSVQQFISQGFVERKIMMICDVISICKHMHNEMLRPEFQPNPAGKRKSVRGTSSIPGYPSNHIWGSPFKKDLPGIIHASPPPSAARQRKKAMHMTPPHLQGPQGQVEVVDGEVVPGVKVIRGSKQQGGPPGHTLAWSLSADQLPEGAVPGHVFVEESESRQSPTVEVQIEEALVEEVAVEEVHEVADEEGEEAPRQAMPAFNGTFAGWVRQARNASDDEKEFTPKVTSAGSNTKKDATVSSNKQANDIFSQDAAGTKKTPKSSSGKTRRKSMKSVVTEQAEFQSEGIEGSPEDAKLVQQGGLEAMVLELQRRLEAAETRITEVTTSSRRAEQTLQARIIILEGRVRFLEGAVEEHADKINHKCQDCGRVEVPASKLLIPKPSGYDDEVHLVVPRKYSSGNAAGSGRDLQAKSTGTFEPGNAADLANDFSTSGKDTALGRALELLDSTRSHMSHAPPPRTFCKMHGNALSDQVTQAGGSRGHSKADVLLAGTTQITHSALHVKDKVSIPTVATAQLDSGTDEHSSMTVTPRAFVSVDGWKYGPSPDGSQVDGNGGGHRNQEHRLPADTAEFISGIAGRFEAAKALLDSM